MLLDILENCIAFYDFLNGITSVTSSGEEE